VYGCYRKPVIVHKFSYAYFVLQNALLYFSRPLLTPWSHMDYFYDGWMCFFLGLKNLGYHSLIKLERARILFNISPIVFG